MKVSIVVQLAELPKIGIGTYKLRDQEAINMVSAALEIGYRHIDTAQLYLNEREVGEALRSSGLKREEFFITTKIDPANLNPQNFLASAEKSMATLGTAPDLLLIHWPPREAPLKTNLDLILEAQAKGFTKHIGVSNFTVALMEEAQQHCGGKIICNQVEFHPLLNQDKVLAAAARLNITIAAHCPLARGKLLENQILVDIAARHQRPVSEIALRWIIEHGAVPMPKTASPVKAKSNFAALDFTLSAAEIAAINAIGSAEGRCVKPEFMQELWDR